MHCNNKMSSRFLNPGSHFLRFQKWHKSDWKGHIKWSPFLLTLKHCSSPFNVWLYPSSSSWVLIGNGLISGMS
jgi:hypothetical protein